MFVILSMPARKVRFQEELYTIGSRVRVKLQNHLMRNCVESYPAAILTIRGCPLDLFRLNKEDRALSLRIASKNASRGREEMLTSSVLISVPLVSRYHSMISVSATVGMSRYHVVLSLIHI